MQHVWLRSFRRSTEWWLPLSIVALALVLRMAWPTLVEFKYDEANAVRRALAIAYEGDRPAIGAISSVGTFHPPLHFYLLALPLRLWADPVAAVLFVGLLHGLAVLACYCLGRTYLGREVGLIAAYLFAVNSWAVVYARKIWTQNQPLVTVLFFMALLAFVVHGRPWALSGALLAMAALISLHLGGLAFIPVFVLALFIAGRRPPLWPLLLGGLLFVGVLAPYVIYDLAHGAEKIIGFWRYVSDEGHFSAEALRLAFLLIGSKAGLTLVGAHRDAYVAGLPNLWWLDWGPTLALAAALPYTLVRALRSSSSQRRTLLVLLLWFSVPILLQSRPTRPVYPHYFILLYPVPFLLIAFLVIDVGRRIPDWKLTLAHRSIAWKHLALIAMLVVWGVWNIATLGRFWFVMNMFPTEGGYGVPLKYKRQAAHMARALASSGEAIVLTEGMTPMIDEEPTIFEALLFGTPHRFADHAWALPVPDVPQIVYLAGRVPPGATSFAPLLDETALIQSPTVSTKLTLPDGWAYHLVAFPREVRLALLNRFTPFPHPVVFANGVQFVGHMVRGTPQPGKSVEVWLVWQVHQAQPSQTEYHFFVHLLDENGRRYAQHDGTGFPTYAWRAGDLVLSRFVLSLPSDLPPGRFILWAGMYTYPDIVNVPVLDASGSPGEMGVWLGDVMIEAP